ncbi:MAG: C10 family peptidase [Prevotella sp.]|nr:C10 family peptidase [Prevotella sp.]
MNNSIIRSLSILALILLPVVSNAQKISEQQALLKAQQFMKGKVFIKANKARGAQKDTSVPSAFYVFNVEDNGGFVIISGDERTPMVLGYSDYGYLDMENLPSNVQWLMDYYEDCINSLTAADGPVRLKAPAKPEIPPLIPTQWGQDTPFNNQCPVIGSQHALTGCVATAMAQVMNYYQWPKGATAAIPSYTTETLGITRPELSPTTFNWSSLSDADKARLSVYCGQAMTMDYRSKSNGSSANGNNAGVGLYKYFDYDVNARALSRDNYTETDWIETLYAELEAKRPIIYSGRGTGGHTFICDGYKNGQFHINWGWNGLDDGYFLISGLKPGGYDFSLRQIAVVGIQPNTGNAPQMPVLRLESFNTLSTTTFTRSNVSQPFYINSIIAFLGAAVLKDMECNVGFRLYQGTKPVSPSILGANYPNTYPASDVVWEMTSGYYSGGISLGAGLPDGTYRLVLVHKVAGSSTDYEPAQGSDANYIECVINGNTLKLSIVMGTPIPLEEPEVVSGDLNSDGEVDVTDVVELIDMVLAGSTDPSGDINGDGEVDVTDVVELIDIVLAGE